MNIKLIDNDGFGIRILDKIEFRGKEIYIQYLDGTTDTIGHLNDDDPDDIYWNIDDSISPGFSIIATNEEYEPE